MKAVPSAISPVTAVDRKVAKPLHRQIYDAYRGKIIGPQFECWPANSVHASSGIRAWNLSDFGFDRPCPASG